MERIFEFLFKYPPLFFEQGDFTFGAPMSVRLWLIIAGTLGAATVASYTIARGKSTVTDRGVMAGLRVLLLAVIIVCLLQPSLILSTVVPQQNFVGILIDDSQSMLLADENGEPRNSFINEEFASDESELLRQLSDRFALRYKGGGCGGGGSGDEEEEEKEEKGEQVDKGANLYPLAPAPGRAREGGRLAVTAPP